jgi:integrase
VLMGIGGWDAMHTEMNAEIDKQEATARAVQSIKAKEQMTPPRSKR